MSYDTNGAIDTLKNGLTMDRPKSFQQADGLVRAESHFPRLFMLTPGRSFLSSLGLCCPSGVMKSPPSGS